MEKSFGSIRIAAHAASPPGHNWIPERLELAKFLGPSPSTLNRRLSANGLNDWNGAQRWNIWNAPQY
jgi:hypothetical protein